MLLDLCFAIVDKCSFCGKHIGATTRCCECDDCSCKFGFCSEECVDKFNEKNNTTS